MHPEVAAEPPDYKQLPKGCIPESPAPDLPRWHKRWVLDIQYSEWIFFKMDGSIRFSTLWNICNYSSNLSTCRSARFFLIKPCDLNSTLYMFPIHFSHTCIIYPYHQQNMPSSFFICFFCCYYVQETSDVQPKIISWLHSSSYLFCPSWSEECAQHVLLSFK